MGGDIVFNSNWDAVGVDGGLVGNDVKAVWERGNGGTEMAGFFCYGRHGFSYR